MRPSGEIARARLRRRAAGPPLRRQLPVAELARSSPGDLLCLYSDGITECTSPADEEFGLERLERLLRDERERPLPEIARGVDGAMLDFAAGSPQSDDQTLVLLRRTA